jgi:DNA-directed RNA polymerase sigma subunit (sigma70/sigma32)
VVKVAYEYRSCGLSMANLIQEGNIGLMKAAQKLDPDKKIDGYFGVSPGRARQLELRATRKLKRDLNPLASDLRLAA